MRTRLAMAVMLLLLLLAQSWGLLTAWRHDPLRGMTAIGKKKARVAVPGGRLSLQPSPLGALPDLNEGYIFNAERSLAAGEGKEGQSRSAANIAIDKIQFSGSIITATAPRALLKYSLGGQPGLPGGDAAPQQGFLRVAIGDTVDGYKVIEILPEKIIFSRDGHKITKLLYDKAKDRGEGVMSPPRQEREGQITPASPGTPAVKVAEPPRRTLPRQQLQPPPSDEELRKRPLRKRPEPRDYD